jgi:DNA-binding MarR family transcriptional regulator
MVEPVEAVERAMVAIRRSQTRRAMTRLGAGPGLDPSLFAVLDAIEGFARQATVTDVAAELGVDQPRASRLVARAVEQGLLVRTADQRDGRKALLGLTERARAQLAAMHAFRQEVFAAAMAEWPERDRAEFARLITAFVESYAAVVRPRPGDPG